MHTSYVFQKMKPEEIMYVSRNVTWNYWVIATTRYGEERFGFSFDNDAEAQAFVDFMNEEETV